MVQSVLWVASIVLGMSVAFSLFAFGGISLHYSLVQTLFGRRIRLPTRLRKIMAAMLYSFGISILTIGILVALEVFQPYPIPLAFCGVLTTFVLTTLGSLISLNWAEKIINR